MKNFDKRIDAYIAKAQPFAKPILEHLRHLVHNTCPEVEETIKWGFPHFDYKGEMMCSMASFKQHCAFGFWKASLMKDLKLIENARSESAMGHLGRITSLNDLPSDRQLTAYIKEAMLLNESGIKIQKSLPAKKKTLTIPKYFLDAVKKNKKAFATFEQFSYSNKKEYLEWVTEAKTEETRHQRLSTAVEWMSEGKVRNWKYMMKRNKHSSSKI